MTLALDMQTPIARIQNVGNLKAPTIERNHYSSISGHDYSYTSNKSTSGKRNIALTALTLLAFMFFLNILQNCLQEQMNQSGQQVMVISSRLKQQKLADRKDEGSRKVLIGEKATNGGDEEKTYLKIGKRGLNVEEVD